LPPGGEFEYAVIDVASDIANLGVFLIPQGFAPFSYSGCRQLSGDLVQQVRRFQEMTVSRSKTIYGLDTAFRWRSGTAYR
jgi:hypothetical protein